MSPAPFKPKRLLCIDPGPEYSGAVVFDELTREVTDHTAATPNQGLLTYLETSSSSCDLLIIEHVEYFGIPVGRDIFETVRWTGIFQQAFGLSKTLLFPRRDVKIALCGNSATTGANVRRAILDRFEASGGGKTPQIGTKPKPGPLYGMKSHAFSALALGLVWRDTFHQESPWNRLIPKTAKKREPAPSTKSSAFTCTR